MSRTIYIYERSAEGRAMLRGRLLEAARQADVGDVVLREFTLQDIDGIDWDGAFCCVLGPDINAETDEIVDRLRAAYPLGAVALTLAEEDYADRAVALRRSLAVQVFALHDIAQLTGFLLSTATEPSLTTPEPLRDSVIGICQLKGGVGGTTITAALGGCWARHGLSVAMVDLDDVNPHLTAWARATSRQRTMSSYCLRHGEVDPTRLNELVAPIFGFDGRFVVVPQPELYNDGFHCKANVIDEAPSASDFITSSLAALGREFNVVVFDLARSWGIATLAALRRCSHVVLIIDDDFISLERSLANLTRLRQESGDLREFDLQRWSVILNGNTGRNLSATEAASIIGRAKLFPAETPLYTLPFSSTAQRWSQGSSTFYEVTDQRCRDILRKIACNLVPFRYDVVEKKGGKLFGRLHSPGGPKFAGA